MTSCSISTLSENNCEGDLLKQQMQSLGRRCKWLEEVPATMLLEVPLTDAREIAEKLQVELIFQGTEKDTCLRKLPQ